MQNLYDKLAGAARDGKPAALCMVVDTHGSVPLKKGAKMLVWQDGSITGTVGGGNLEHRVIRDAREVIASGEAKIFRHDLVRDHQMCCGGTVVVYIEPVKPQQKLFVFGAGHVGKKVAYFSVPLGYRVTLVDERRDMLEQVAAEGVEIMSLHHRDALPLLPLDKNSCVLICTHLHRYDREILAYCIGRDLAYLGMIGSKRKVLVTRKQFLEKGLADEDGLAKVDMPVGWDLGNTSPAHIALGIVAKITAVLNNKQAVFHNETEYAPAYRDSDGCC